VGVLVVWPRRAGYVGRADLVRGACQSRQVGPKDEPTRVGEIQTKPLRGELEVTDCQSDMVMSGQARISQSQVKQAMDPSHAPSPQHHQQGAVVPPWGRCRRETRAGWQGGTARAGTGAGINCVGCRRGSLRAVVGASGCFWLLPEAEMEWACT
jgi:hypothetical protein